MSQPYQSPAYPEPYPEPEYYEPEPKKKMSGWLIALIIILVLIVVCCLCSCPAALLAGPAIGDVFSAIMENLDTPMP